VGSSVWGSREADGCAGGEQGAESQGEAVEGVLRWAGVGSKPSHVGGQRDSSDENGLRAWGWGLRSGGSGGRSPSIWVRGEADCLTDLCIAVQ